MRRRATILLAVLLLAACGGAAAFLVSVTFPDQAARDQTVQVKVIVVKPEAQAQCGDLTSGSAKPGDSGYTIEDEVDVAYPPKQDPRSLKVVGPGRRLFFAEGADVQAQAILRGCTETVASGGGVHEVTIALAWLAGPCQLDQDCDDQNPCTDDTCGPKKTCLHTDNTAPCDDGKFCTASDTCSGGVCSGTGDRCPGQQCDEAGKRCFGCNSDADCDDSNLCTDDHCNPRSGCEHANNSAPCDDGKFCTASDTCSGGVCTGTGDRCPGQVCDEAGGRCVGCTADADCNDQHTCTADSCEEASGTCLHTPNATLCPDDGIYCNGTESCDPTAPGVDPVSGCTHSGNPCIASGKVCQEATQMCVPCTSDGDCDDKLSCTDDRCDPGTNTCTRTPNNSKCLDDGVFCNGAERCSPAAPGSDPVTGCVHGGNPCAGGAPCNLTCNEGAKNCFDASNTSCDDGVYCNGADLCDGAGACTHRGDPCVGGAVCNRTCNEGAKTCFDAANTPCGDGVYCNGADVCNGAGACTHGGDPCVGGAVCNRTCNEGAKNCYDAASTSCDDSIYCNGADVCSGAGACTHRGDPCVGGAMCNRTCNEWAKNCFDPVGTVCDDGRYCTVGETCRQGSCVGTPKDCTDTDPCTVDSCNETNKQCDHVVTPNPGAEGPIGDATCSDGLDDDCDGWTDYQDFDCFLPSNVSLANANVLHDPRLLDVAFVGIGSPVTVNSDDGSIVDGSGNTLRPAGTGIIAGISFVVAPQPGSATTMNAGVFAMKSLNIPTGISVIVVGSNPIIVLALNEVDIAGTIDTGARRDPAAPAYEGWHLAGPGGYLGGAAETAGSGGCGGGADGGSNCDEGCTSGGGGAGHGGTGGKGGDGAYPPDCTTVYTGGAGGGLCDASALKPISGGSGGGGGGLAAGSTSLPGSGGAGGGALQISSMKYIHLAGTGVLTAPGGGGGGGSNNEGGGGGGGAGGAILLESVDVTLDANSVVAANGGGGGSGDCG